MCEQPGCSICAYTAHLVFISKPTILECTAWRWLHNQNGALAPHNMACIWMAMSAQMLLHTEMPLLRAGRNIRSVSTYGIDGNELPKPNGFSVPGGKFCLILLTYDESTFYQNDLRKTNWAYASTKATSHQKRDGQSTMVSDFLTSEWGCLYDGEEFVGFPFIWITII